MPASAQLLVILVAIIAFWVLVMRPARNQQKKVADLQRQLEVGQQIVLSAGIFGTIRSLGDTQVEVEVAPGTVITVARQVVVRRAEELEQTTSAEYPHDDPDAHVIDETGPDGPAGQARTQD